MKNVILLLFVATFLSACTPEPESIQFGKDQCAFCKMSIADPKFGAELVTEKGRVYKFDAVECMVPYMHDNDDAYSHVLAIAYDQPEKLFPVSEMQFVISNEIRSPMGAWLLAFSNPQRAKEYAQNGALYDWNGIEEYLLNEDW